MVNYFEIFTPINNIIVQDIRPNTYYISNYGRVWSTVLNNVMVEAKDHNGYSVIQLRLASGKSKLCKIHRLVAKAFIPINNPDLYQVNHINGIKTCNFVHNLEWVTAYENIHHAMDTGLRNCYGEKVHTSVLTNDIVIKISELLIQNKSYQDIINTLGLVSDEKTVRQISRIRSKETWQNITTDYNFDNYNPMCENQVFTFDEIHKICECLQYNGVTTSIQEIMDYIGRGDFFKSLSYKDKKRYYSAITKLKNKSRYKDICNLYQY